jgi:hypothetical protein
LIILGFIPIVTKFVSIHPNENVYFNVLTKGLGGAKEAGIPYAGNSYGSAYRQGVNWINENVEEGGKVVIADGLIPNIPSFWFRSDLEYNNSFEIYGLKVGVNTSV